MLFDGASCLWQIKLWKAWHPHWIQVRASTAAKAPTTTCLSPHQPPTCVPSLYDQRCAPLPKSRTWKPQHPWMVASSCCASTNQNCCLVRLWHVPSTSVYSNSPCLLICILSVDVKARWERFARWYASHDSVRADFLSRELFAAAEDPEVGHRRHWQLMATGY